MTKIKVTEIMRNVSNKIQGKQSKTQRLKYPGAQLSTILEEQYYHYDHITTAPPPFSNKAVVRVNLTEAVVKRSGPKPLLKPN